MPAKHVSILVRGRVQGVFFRASTKDKADELGIKGFVRNEDDGNVYLEAEGEKEMLDQLAAWCALGPPRSIVEGVKINEGEWKGFEKFEIRRG